MTADGGSLSKAGITVAVDFMGPVTRPNSAARELDVTLTTDDSVQALLSELGYHPSHFKALGVFRDGRRLPLSAALKHGQSVTISVPFGGG